MIGPLSDATNVQWFSFLHFLGLALTAFGLIGFFIFLF